MLNSYRPSLKLFIFAWLSNILLVGVDRQIRKVGDTGDTARWSNDIVHFDNAWERFVGDNMHDITK